MFFLAFSELDPDLSIGDRPNGGGGENEDILLSKIGENDRARPVHSGLP